MPKTLTEIKKTSAYSEEFEKAVSFIKITREYTPAVVAAIEKLIHAPPPKHPKPNELERLAQAAQKYMPYFVSGCFYETLQATANVCNSVAKHEREVQMEAFQRVVTPIKSWILEDYPRLMKAILDIKKCYQLKDKMDRTMASAEARRTPERVAKAHEAKNKHKQFFERIENEVLRYKAVHRHHMQCLKVLMLQSYQFEQKAKNAFSAAFTKCEAEIEAGSAAIKELRKGTTTVEETEVKESNKEGEKDANAEEQADSKKDDKKEEEKVSSKKSSQKLEKKDECHKEDAKDNESAVSMKDKVNEKETEKESAENPGDKKKEESSKDLSNLT